MCSRSTNLTSIGIAWFGWGTPENAVARYSITIGTRFPAYATSMGRVLLAGLPDDALNAYLARVSFARLTGKPGMVNRGKIAELYHPDWVARAGGLSLPDPTPFDTGFAETVTWYRKAGWLPQGRGTDTRTASSRTFQ